MRNLFKAALVAGLATSANAASAQESDTGFYIGVNAGVAGLGDADVSYYEDDGEGGEFSLDSEFAFKSAATFGGVVGYDFGPVRADVEVAYARNKVKSLTVTGIDGEEVTLDPADRDEVCDFLEADTCGGSGNTFTVDGSRARQLSAMANVWADFPIGGAITPYVGGGIGIAGFEVDGEGKGKFAWQLGAGAALRVSEGIEITADYRHREVSKTNIAWDADSGLRVGKLKTDSFTAGLRFRF